MGGKFMDFGPYLQAGKHIPFACPDCYLKIAGPFILPDAIVNALSARKLNNLDATHTNSAASTRLFALATIR